MAKKKTTSYDDEVDTTDEEPVETDEPESAEEEAPLPPPEDVDVASVDPGSGEGELIQPPTVADWVVLGDHPDVPERFIGHRAAVLEAPRDLIDEADAADTFITVRTRDDANATLQIPLDAIAEVERGGHSVVVRG